jgi:hypothetical protein
MHMACGGIVRGNHDISVELDEPTTLVQIARAHVICRGNRKRKLLSVDCSMCRIYCNSIHLVARSAT